MIVAEIKPFDEIRRMIEDYEKILVLGCGSCVTVCMSGGERQVELLASALRMARKLEGKTFHAAEKTIMRQCDEEFIDQIRGVASEYDAILSMACGAGVQGVTERLGHAAVLPAMNTTFLGASDTRGGWVETCAACGNCILDQTGGICPVARCAKGLIHGPCGGAQKGFCEISLQNPCVWQLIFARMKGMNRLHLLGQVDRGKRPLHPRRLERLDRKSRKGSTEGA